QHSIPSLGFVIQEGEIVGKIDINTIRPVLMKFKDEFAKQGIANPLTLLKRLQMGQDLLLPDGTNISPPPNRPGRKLVILGDTCDPSLILPHSHSADLVIHEATNACLTTDMAQGLTHEQVEQQAISHGHSTPQMAGEFAV